MTIINAVGGDKKVKITSGDKKTDFLFNKLVAGTGITLTILNPGADEDIEISLAGGGGQTDHHNGFFIIKDGVTITVDDCKQMTTWNGLVIDGTLNIDGELYLEP